jgi:hypothetical protein
LIKAVFVVAGIALALISVPEHSSFGSKIPEMALFVVSIEWLVYQSRYQWNDIRGLHEDELAPSRSDRRRLPGRSRRHSEVRPGHAVAHRRGPLGRGAGLAR